jgi:hypothetical protein
VTVISHHFAPMLESRDVQNLSEFASRSIIASYSESKSKKAFFAISPTKSEVKKQHDCQPAHFSLCDQPIFIKLENAIRICRSRTDRNYDLTQVKNRLWAWPSCRSATATHRTWQVFPITDWRPTHVQPAHWGPCLQDTTQRAGHMDWNQAQSITPRSVSRIETGGVKENVFKVR